MAYTVYSFGYEVISWDTSFCCMHRSGVCLPCGCSLHSCNVILVPVLVWSELSAVSLWVGNSTFSLSGAKWAPGWQLPLLSWLGCSCFVFTNSHRKRGRDRTYFLPFLGTGQAPSVSILARWTHFRHFTCLEKGWHKTLGKNFLVPSHKTYGATYLRDVKTAEKRADTTILELGESTEARTPQARVLGTGISKIHGMLQKHTMANTFQMDVNNSSIPAGMHH